MKAKIKVAEVITRMDWGGSPDIVRLICTMSDPEKFDIRLVAGSSANLSLQTKEFRKRFKNNIDTITQLKREINPLADLIALVKLYKLFRREKFDIVHTHTAKAGMLGRIAARMARVPYIVHTPHGHNFYGYFGRFMTGLIIMAERFVAHFTDRITVLTELEKRDFVDFKVARAERLEVIASGLELDKFCKSGMDSDRKRMEFLIEPDEMLVGMIGRLEPVKGPEYLIEAAKLIIDKFPKVKFLIVGDGSLRRKLEYRCERLHISDKVIFAGWREDTPQILPILDLLVLPSLNEAVGRIILEAGACGIPAVAANVGGIPEIVKDNKTGMLVPPKSPHELAKAIQALLIDDDKRQRMGRAAKKWVDDKFSAQRMVEKINNMYDELISMKK